MDKLNSMTAQALSKLNIQGIKVAEPYGSLLGEPEANAVMFIWGEKGAGKSTFSLGLANALAGHGRVEYIPAEEHFGKTLVDKVKRLDATHPNLNFTKWKSTEALKTMLQETRASFCVLDSITVIEANDKETVDLAQWCRDSGIGFLMVAHATKDGRYKGNTSIAHECDIEIKVTLEGEAVAEKNRYRTLTSIAVPFTAKDLDKPASVRENPVDVPFRMSLAEIDKLHKFRSWRRINSLMGSKMPCYAKTHSGESDSAHFSIRYTPDYRRKKYVLELLLDGRLEAQICTTGAKGGFKASWRQLVDEYGDIEVMIYSQDHAKKVLGAKEYARQETKFKQAQKKGEASPPDKAESKQEKLTSLVKRYNLPEIHKNYFNNPQHIVSLSKVEVRKKNPEKSIERALGLMKQSADGEGEKRDPIEVYKEGNSYIVVDGNATASVAKRAGWSEIPITLVNKPGKKPARKPSKKKKPAPASGKDVAGGIKRAVRDLKKLSAGIKTKSVGAWKALEDKAVIDGVTKDFEAALADTTYMRTRTAETIDNYYDLFRKTLGDEKLRRRTTAVIDELDEVLRQDALDQLEQVRREADKDKPAKKKKKGTSSSGTKKKSKKKGKKTGKTKSTKPKKKQPKKSDGIDIEAARKSQSKLDAFLEKVLS
jgi:hypothetical protein